MLKIDELDSTQRLGIVCAADPRAISDAVCTVVPRGQPQPHRSVGRGVASRRTAFRADERCEDFAGATCRVRLCVDVLAPDTLNRTAVSAGLDSLRACAGADAGNAKLLGVR
jgi:hypothetical protein